MTTSASTASRGDRLALPTLQTIINLAIGGCAGLGLWEAFSAVPTAWVAGFPLQPPELVKSLFYNLFGWNLSLTTAQLLHFGTGILGYPLGYFVLTRYVKSLGMPADGWIWGVITYFIALGFFAPLAGQHFLLYDLPRLSFMSLIGHAAYGYIAAYVFEALERR